MLLRILVGILLALLLVGLATILLVVWRVRRARAYNASLKIARAQLAGVRQTAEVDYVIHQIEQELQRQRETGEKAGPGRAQRLEELKSIILRCRSLQPAPLSIGRLCAGVVEASRETAGDREILYFEPNGGDSLQVMGDPESLGWALKELLSNVFAHGGEWSRIEIQLEPADRTVILSVRDNGTGPDLTAATRLYSAFSARLGSGGPGLGLFTVRRIVERVGGTIEARPGSDGGLTHTLRLPNPSAVPVESGKKEVGK